MFFTCFHFELTSENPHEIFLPQNCRQKNIPKRCSWKGLFEYVNIFKEGRTQIELSRIERETLIFWTRFFSQPQKGVIFRWGALFFEWLNNIQKIYHCDPHEQQISEIKMDLRRNFVQRRYRRKSEMFYNKFTQTWTNASSFHDNKTKLNSVKRRPSQFKEVLFISDRINLIIANYCNEKSILRRNTNKYCRFQQYQFKIVFILAKTGNNNSYEFPLPIMVEYLKVHFMIFIAAFSNNNSWIFIAKIGNLLHCRSGWWSEF